MLEISQITKWYNLTNFSVTSNMFHYKYKDKSFTGVTCETSFPAKKRVSLRNNEFPYEAYFSHTFTYFPRGWSISNCLVSYFLKLGIWLWTECACLCIWNTSLLLLTCFCSWVLQLITQVLMLVVSLCKPVICKLKIFGEGNLVGGTTKREDQILKFQWGDTIFDPNLVVWKILEETMDYECSIK